MNNREKTTTEDLQLLSQLVSRLLRNSIYGAKAPSAKNYVVTPEADHPMGRGWLRVAAEIRQGMKVQLEHVWWPVEDEDLDTLVEKADSIAEALERLSQEADMLEDMLEEVRSVAKREVSKARRRGLPYRLISVDLPVIDATSADGLFAVVEIEALQPSLRLGMMKFQVETGEELVACLADARTKQEARAERLTEFQKAGATGAIDIVVLNALKDAGLNERAIIEHIRESDDRIVDFPIAGERQPLYWEDGILFARLELGEGAHWNAGTLTLSKSPVGASAKTGFPLADIFPHPYLTPEITVAWVTGKKGASARINCQSEFSLFHHDADAFLKAA